MYSVTWFCPGSTRLVLQGWSLEDGQLGPVASERAPAPNKLLGMVSCGCKGQYGKACGCRKVGLFCTAICASCSGESCNKHLHTGEA